MTTKSIAVTNLGHKREQNEDAYFASDKFQLYAVADGMGGHADGEIASRKAIEAISKSTEIIGTADPHAILSATFQAAHNNICQAIERPWDRRNMGTTLVALQVKDNFAYIHHAGDSRAYSIRDTKIKRITNDHVGYGGLTNSLGCSDTWYKGSDPQEVEVLPNDIFVLCSDGFSDYDEDGVFEEIVKNTEFQDLANRMVQKALDLGGHDNITVITIKVL